LLSVDNVAGEKNYSRRLDAREHFGKLGRNLGAVESND
jgi:hypothetical protein